MSTIFSATACSTERSFTGVIYNMNNNTFIVANGYWANDGRILAANALQSILFVLSIGMV